MTTALQPAPTAALPSNSPDISTAPAPDLPQEGGQLYRLGIEQYHAMAETGILEESKRVHLIEGLLVTKMTKHSPHMLATGLAQDALTQNLPAGWFVSMGDPITIAESASEPEPDVAVVRGPRRDYGMRRITPADVGLIVEVADASIRKDQVRRKALYARAAIPFYWLVNLPAHRLEVYSDPTGPDPTTDYRKRADHGPDDSVPLVLDGREVARIAVRDLLP